MKQIDVTQEMLVEMELFGRKVLFTDLRVDENTVPENLYCYCIRHRDDDDNYPAALEEKVVVNYYGAVITTEPFEFGLSDYLEIDEDDYGFTGVEMFLDEFLDSVEEE